MGKLVPESVRCLPLAQRAIAGCNPLTAQIRAAGVVGLEGENEGVGLQIKGSHICTVTRCLFHLFKVALSLLKVAGWGRTLLLVKHR